MTPFGPFRPDVFDLNSAVAGEARGVLPGATAYRPWPSLAVYSEAIGAEVLSGFLARARDGALRIYAGTATGLFLYTGPTTPWTDVSGDTYAVPPGERWGFEQYGDTLIAVNANTDPQKLDISASTPAEDLGGSPPRARYVKTVGDQVWLGGLLMEPDKVIWSGRDNPEFWTLGQQDCDQQVFPDGGFVRGLTALEAGLVFQDTAIRRFVPVDSRAIYTFARVEDARGLVAPDSLTVRGRVAYYLSQEGFMATDGTGASLPIGFENVDVWFQKRISPDESFSIQGAADPLRPRVYWLYETAAGPNEILVYDIALKAWAYAQVPATFIMGAATPGLTLEGLDSLGYTLDTLPFSLDSRQFMGGAPLLAAFSRDANQLNFFTGANMAARLETAELQPVPGQRSFVRGVAPLTEAPGVTVQIGTRENLQSTRVWSTASSINAQGNCPTRASGRFVRARVSVPAGGNWQNIQGVDIDAVQDGKR
ncbi:hypothetical protein [Kaistia terrae]|uniref:Uncharacterized protein n=1 Tax=Kaistia terrae TaxID=537017 RepID=A0ABW0Q2V5_9HYPH|nr:hypothetical protein [Kaistia terrae]MCX5581490.1 hypothetical protein [Kaistia terrae]